MTSADPDQNLFEEEEEEEEEDDEEEEEEEVPPEIPAMRPHRSKYPLRTFGKVRSNTASIMGCAFTMMAPAISSSIEPACFCQAIPPPTVQRIHVSTKVAVKNTPLTAILEEAPSTADLLKKFFTKTVQAAYKINVQQVVSMKKNTDTNPVAAESQRRM